MKLPAEPGTPSAPQPDGTRLPAIVRYWWLTAVRGLALTLALAIVIAGRGTARLVTFLGLYWMAGGLLTLRFAFAIRPRRGGFAAEKRWDGDGRLAASCWEPWSRARRRAVAEHRGRS